MSFIVFLYLLVSFSAISGQWGGIQSSDWEDPTRWRDTGHTGWKVGPGDLHQRQADRGEGV